LVSIQETAYPRLKSSYSKKELDDVYTPTLAELEWTTQTAKSPVSKLGLVVSLKVSQRLGYFVPITDVPTCIREHVAQLIGVPSIPQEALKLYNESGTCRRHHSLIRNYRNIRVFDTSSRLIMLEAMTEAALTKDDPADLINVAIEKLVRQHYELPAFSALAKAADHVHAKSYRELYERIFRVLDANAGSIIDNLFQKIPSQSPYTPWHQIKQDPSNPTLTHLKELVAHREWLSERNIGTQALQGIPLAKVK
jgi:hypothetical protein